MTPERRQELREWSLKLCGHTQICSPDCAKYPLPYVRDKDGRKFSWAPDSDSAPASQILGVIDAMAKLGYDYYQTLYTDESGNNAHFYKDDNSQGFRSGFKRKELLENILEAGWATGVGR